jgi:hypothetical protein
MCLCGLRNLAAGSPNTIRMVNTGKMAIAGRPAGKSSLYLPHAVLMTGNKVAVRQDGTSFIGGNFYQDATTNVFYRDVDGKFASTGKIVFFRNTGKNETGAKRYVTTKAPANSIDNFDRGAHFVAFPQIEIRTGDTLVIPAKMGIDALKIVRNTADHGNDLGKLLLESKSYPDGSGGQLSYDASLRITGDMKAASAELIPPGAVIVERDLTPYRVETGSGTGNGTLFAFASPFKTQRAAYFAGNWIRQMLVDDPSSGHISYVYGDKTANGVDGTILDEQYLYHPTETFTPGKGYLVKLRAKGFDYSGLIASGGLGMETGGNATDYELDKFIFDGKPFNMPAVEEQLFADSVLFRQTVNITNNPKTINWIIGNSYSAPIHLDSLAKVMAESDLYFAPYIYVFPAGSTDYQPLHINKPTSSMDVAVVEKEIPAMSYFMIRLSKGRKQVGTFTLCRNRLLAHGKASHGSLRSSSSGYSNEVVFRVSPASTPNIYDLAGIGLRADGNPNTDNNDLPKAGAGSCETFRLYSLSGDGQKLSANIVPETTKAVSLCFSPGAANGMFTLNVSRMESLRTSGLWLEDRKEGIVTDLLQTNGVYLFEASPGDLAERFTVRFQPSPATGVGDEGVSSAPLPRIVNVGNEIIIKGLSDDDAGSRLQITDLQGRLLRQATVVQSPEMRLPAPSADGIYIFRMEGKRILTLKFRR